MTGLVGKLIAAALLTVSAIAPDVQAQAATVQISAEDWSAYKAKFLDASGRIIDDANDNISHSEGQGYGLLLALLAGSRADFDRIWAFTRTEMLLRDDGLAVWKWDPAAAPHVTDNNNASDGDILIAYALGRAGEEWQRPDLSKLSAAMAEAIWTSVVVTSQGRTLLLPGAVGFQLADREDGPVVNLSYWVFEAFPMLARMAPGNDWAKLSADGLALIAQASAGGGHLPPDWLSLQTVPRPAKGYAPEFGYNALRIPLYLMRAGTADRQTLQPFLAMTGTGGSVRLANALTGSQAATLSDPGYAIIPALLACVLDGTPIPPALRSFSPTNYYPSTLHLLGLDFAARSHPECL